MKLSYQIRGMYCPNCEKRITATLGKTDGVKAVRVDYASGRAEIESKKPLNREQLQSALHDMGYELSDVSDELTRAVSLLVIILGLTVILDRIGLLNRLVPQQLGMSGMSYGLFFVTGLLTSVHCVAMCGGINLSQSLPGRGRWSALLYNAGRVASYTLIGALLGAAGYLLGGGSLAVLPLLQGAVKLLAGAFILLAGINLLGLFPALRSLRLPLPKLRGSSRLPFVIGLLNGLMPCGPLQAMQLAALGTGSPLNGALSMHALFQPGHRTPHAGARRIGRSLGTALCPNGQSRRRGAGGGVRRRYALTRGCPLRHDRQLSALGGSAVSLVAGPDYACPRGETAASGIEHRGADGAGSHAHPAQSTDGLNTHTIGSLYETFPPEHAFALASRLEIHYTPRHGSWLNIAEIELSALGRQCIGTQRIPDLETLKNLLAPWAADRNLKQRGVSWHFTADDARTKLRHLYPIFQI